jgi:hypothetical protein
VEKSERELMVFREFGRCVGIPHKSIESRKQPEPDIFCLFKGQPVYFEVTIGTDCVAEKMMADYDISEGVGGIGFAVDVFGGVCSILGKKLAKTYVTPATQTIQLLVYMESGVERLLMEKLERESWLEDRVRNGRFSMIWFYDRNYCSAPVGYIEREPFRVFGTPTYASFGFRASVMVSSLVPRSKK